jgi:single-stranded-DNA-specific exonuclease
MDSLRLLCTLSQKRAAELAAKLGLTNRERQDLTLETTRHARNLVKKGTKIIFVHHETYNQGVIGLVAGKLVEEFYRPAIVISRGELVSKASARSINGFNIIEAIHQMDDLLVDAGGHPMAAGFTIETGKLTVLEKRLEELAERELTEDVLTRTFKIDMEINFSDITLKLYDQIREFEPFGFGNPEPVFMSQNVLVKDVRLVGKDADHLRLWLEQVKEGKSGPSPQFSAIGFRMGIFAKTIHPGDIISIVYTIALDTWNGNRKLQLKLRDLRGCISCCRPDV